jgi:uncharacterized protein (DUF302 family)
MNDPMSYDVTLNLTHDAAIELVSDELKKEGFGVLTRIDVHEAFKEKLGKEFRNYTILGACNPSLALQALTARPEVGLLLPCNVTVESTDAGATLVRLVNPHEMLDMPGLGGDETLRGVANDADAGLRRVAQALGG